MRKFKFRAWHNTHMTYFDGMWASEEYRSVCFAATDESLVDNDLCGAYSKNSPDRNSYENFMQYTGLSDKSGKEIYEGDIVQIVAEELKHGDTIQEFRSNVFFVDGSFSYTHDDGHSYPLDSVCSENGIEHKGSHFCEMIGNIYENPELLNMKGA